HSSAGTVSYNAGTGVYAVRGSHTYASAGTFTVAVNIVDEGGATATAVGAANVSGFTPIAISGQAFKDLNGDGVKDAGEPGIDGVTIALDRGADGTVDATTTTSGGGLYSFSGLGPGTYRIRQAARTGFLQTTPNPPDVVAQNGTNVSGVNFGSFTFLVNYAVSADNTRVYMQRFDAASGENTAWTLAAPGMFVDIAVVRHGPVDAPVVFGLGVNHRIYAAGFHRDGTLDFGWFP